VLLLRIRAALPFYAIIGTFFIGTFIDLVQVAVLGGPSSMLSLIILFVASLAVERLVRV
jgi:hypothetical protein